MRLSNVLLTAMLTTTYGSLAQESTTTFHQDSNNEKNPIETSLDSALLKKIERRYAKRNKKKLRQKKTIQKRLVQQESYSEITSRPHYYCPGCGRG